MNTKVASAAKALNNGGTHSVQYNVCEVAEPTTPIVDVFSVSSISFPLLIFLKRALATILGHVRIRIAASLVSTSNCPLKFKLRTMTRSPCVGVYSISSSNSKDI